VSQNPPQASATEADEDEEHFLSGSPLGGEWRHAEGARRAVDFYERRGRGKWLWLAMAEEEILESQLF